MSFNKLIYHIVFRTKDSAQAICFENEKRLYAYIWGLIKQRHCVLYRIGGMPDHLHILVQIPPTMAVSNFVRDIKANSSRFLKQNNIDFPLFYGWGKSYCALVCPYADKDRIVNYIANQKVHHMALAFPDELATLLASADIDSAPDDFFSDDSDSDWPLALYRPFIYRYTSRPSPCLPPRLHTTLTIEPRRLRSVP